MKTLILKRKDGTSIYFVDKWWNIGWNINEEKIKKGGKSKCQV